MFPQFKKKPWQYINNFKKKSPADVLFFNASSGCFSGFKACSVFPNIKFSGGTGGANEEAEKTFYPLLKQNKTNDCIIKPL